VAYEDKLTNVAVRRILTSFWVDIVACQVRTIDGVVYLSGHIQRMTASHRDFSESMLRELDTKIRATPCVRDVKYRFDNWERKLTAHWVPIIAAPVTADRSLT
jgi:hypothetical protein